MLFLTAVLIFGFSGQSSKAQSSPQSDDVIAFRGLINVEMQVQSDFFQATTKEDREKLQKTLEAMKGRLPVELMKLAKEFPNSTGGLAAFFAAAFTKTNDQVADAGFKAFHEQASTSSLVQLADAVSLARPYEMGNNLRIAETLLAIVKKNPTHEKAAGILTCVCRISEADEMESVPTGIFSEAAGLITEHHAASPDIVNFGEILGNGLACPVWAKSFEQHLERIQSTNRHRDVRCTATLALASVVELSRPDDALRLYKRFLSEFDGDHEYHFQAIEKMNRGFAQKAATRLETLAIGMVAPDIVGVDLDGFPMKLRDYRGKVVLVSFWATWCKPCIEFLPHEKEIMETFKEKPFVIVGINGDRNIQTGQETVSTHDLSWRSFRNSGENRPDISKDWGVAEWPTMYLIDVDGMIRNRWIDPEQKEITESIEQLFAGQTAATSDK